jgi:RNA polymerase sigma factor (TIGR02999 family)
MSDVTAILSQIEHGDPQAADQLLPLVYDELRKLAAAKLAQEKPGQTLQATALVHEAYLRLVDDEKVQQWNSRGHFFAAAAEAMRRILVDNARHKGRAKHGGGRRRVNLDADAVGLDMPPEHVLMLDEALTKLAQRDAPAADCGRQTA